MNKITIPEQINTQYRGYALYVIQSRGIPNFYDCITPVQRLILENAPTSMAKTVGLIGAVFSTGLYHHGDHSLSSAIAKLARPFGCSDQILLGDGFFGSPVKPAPAAPRYTMIKIAPRYKKIIEDHSDLNVLNEEGNKDWLHVTHPIGLSTHIVGIAVGYRSNILPRKPEDVEAYLSGDTTKKLKPYFKDFKGRISKVEGLNSTWLIEGVIEIDPIKKSIKIGDISPLQRYDSFMDRLNLLLANSMLDYKVNNRSTEKIEIEVVLRATTEAFEVVSKAIEKLTKQAVTEGIVIVKDGNVIEYETIHDYLDEFRVHKESVLLKRILKDEVYLHEDIEFLKAKLAFLKFMSEKKRSADEISLFLKGYKPKIAKKLEGISLTKLNTDEIKEIEKKIKELSQKAIDIKKEIKTQNDLYLFLRKEWNKNNKGRKMADISSPQTSPILDGIEIWTPEDEQELEINEENNEEDF
jgi:DNA gyrase/topoisomerase IV subunit A